MDTIRIDEIIYNGKKLKSCPFGLVLGVHCYISKVKCRYGLTEIRLPQKCPLKTKPILISFNSKVVETDF